MEELNETPAGEGSILRALYDYLSDAHPADFVQSFVDAYEAMYPTLI